MNDRQHKHTLPPGYELNGYRLVSVLGVGGFGVTYLAEHVRLGQRAAIKEYLPNEFAVREGTAVHAKSASDQESFEWGLGRFLEEAKTLALFEHRNLVRVRDYFEANATAYFVMDYEEGESLDRLLAKHGRLSETQLKRILLPILDGLRTVHAAGFLHRDIKPSNIYVRRSDESPVLLDFGAARQALVRKSHSLTAVASAGYSPPEQYESEGEQGPWSDIYSLSALCYRAISGETPDEATKRQGRLVRGQPDPLTPLSELSPEGFSQELLSAVDWGLRIIEMDRPKSVDTWEAALTGEKLPESASASIAQTNLADQITKSGHDSKRSLWIFSSAATLTVVGLGLWWILASSGASSKFDETIAIAPSPSSTSSAEPDSGAESTIKIEDIPINIPDNALRSAISEQLEKDPSEPIYSREFESLTSLYVPNSGIKSLEGLQYASKLRILDLSNYSTFDQIRENAITREQRALNLNKYSGDLPLLGNTLTDLSPIFELNNLSQLYLVNNNISDNMLSGAEKLSSLEILYISGNRLSIQIIFQFIGLTNLTYLRLSSNELSGQIPKEIGNLTNLTYLDLSYNQLIGKIPREFGNLENLEYLFLEGNILSGEVPEEIGNLANLKALLLAFNQLSGEIPGEIGNLKNLEYLFLDGNILSGEIPGEIQRLCGQNSTSCSW